MKWLRKKGFTLVELMVVIAIISVLAVALMTQVTKLQESARATKCKTNLRTLAQAAQSYSGGIGEYRYPTAGSYEVASVTIPRDYSGYPGWVSWTKGNSSVWPWGNEKSPIWKNSTSKPQGNGMSRETFFGEAAYISLTNGTLWEWVGKDTSVYVCEKHRREAERVLKGEKVYRSYVMSAYFEYDKDRRPKVGGTTGGPKMEDAINDGKAAIRLMFAEMPAQEIRKEERFADSVLEYDMNGNSNRKDESIGFNHQIAKRWVGHVVFVDGHVEGLILPNKAKKGTGVPDYGHPDLKDLTGQLCDAQEIKVSIRETMQ